MPKTKKKFDWEIYDKYGNFMDILSMTRDEIKRYKSKFPEHIVHEISYTDGNNNTW